MAMWRILTGTGTTLRGRYEGTRAQAEKYCRDHYMPKGYRIVRETNKAFLAKWKASHRR